MLAKFKEELNWIPGNGKLINIWQDSILGNSPPVLPRLKLWLDSQGIKMIWDVSAWEIEPPNRWDN